MQPVEALTVALADRSYDIHIGQGLLREHACFADVMTSDTVVVVSNDVVAPLYLDTLQVALSDYRMITHLLPDGERHKTPASMLAVIDTALAGGAARDTTFIALGGGVVGDMTGFAAACFMRGVPYVQVPTTLLAQVDSSVGGKTGVNHAAGKNLIGAFHQPVRVVIGLDSLATLPPREFAAGLAEVIKYGAIVDREFFDWLEENMPRLVAREPAALRHAVRRSCELKAAVVAADEREQGKRALLNFGLTFGHAIEAGSGYTQWVHGEAVAIGMKLAAQMSGIDVDDCRRLESLLSAAGLPTETDAHRADDLLAAMGHDKKVLAGRIRLVLLESLGSAYVTADYDSARLRQVLEGMAVA